MNLNDHIKKETSKGNFTGMVLIDLQKAFDCVDHRILLDKLSAMGVTNVDWFRSYLNDRKQCTHVNGVDSDFLEVTCGVPQGSILGPTLFLCFINDMSDALKCRLSLYADDSALVFSGSDPDYVANFLGSELSICKKWLVDNRLSLHLGKTECILFGPKRKLKTGINFDIMLDGSVVKRVTSVKYLGVLLDQYMDFTMHVDKLLKKAGSKLNFLFRNARFMNQHVRKLLCQSLIFSCIEYCSPSWYSGLSKVLRDSLHVLQRKCARFSLGLNSRAHIGYQELLELNWLPFSQRVSFFSLTHAYKVRNGLSPSYISDEFFGIAKIHSHNLRQSHVNFSLALCRSPTGTFERSVIADWNSLPTQLKESQSLPIFKSSLRRYLQAL